MPLPDLNDRGELPEGLHQATMTEVIERFGGGNKSREDRSALLRRIHERAQATGKLKRFVVFGSYITAKPEPRDVDVVLVMNDDFSLIGCDEEARIIFDHQRAENELGASIFWLTPRVVLRGSLEEFLLGWGTKRDLTRRGIVEVIS
jgi:hypothetical protein